MAACAHAWPRALASSLPGTPVAAFADGEATVLVATGGVEVWAGGRDRVRVAAEAAPPGESVVGALWCGERRALAVLVSGRWREMMAGGGG